MNKVDLMSKEEVLRWSALIEGTSRIYAKAEETGMNPNDVNISHPSLMRYINDKVEHYRTY